MHTNSTTGLHSHSTKKKKQREQYQSTTGNNRPKQCSNAREAQMVTKTKQCSNVREVNDN